MRKFALLCFIVCNTLAFGFTSLVAAKENTQKVEYIELVNLYKHHCEAPSDINEHLPILRELTLECQSIIEIGVRNMVSTWAILQGLSENNTSRTTYLGIDLFLPPLETYRMA